MSIPPSGFEAMAMIERGGVLGVAVGKDMDVPHLRNPLTAFEGTSSKTLHIGITW